MIIDIRNIQSDTVLDRDICIIGGGAAGITMALELANAKQSVIVLESGSERPYVPTQALYAGTCSGNVLPDDMGAAYVGASRQRMLGGSTNCWSGWCLPLDPYDFDHRPWIPDSGWPITYEEVAPFYERSRQYVHIKPFDYDTGKLERSRGKGMFKKADPFFTRMMHKSWDRFGKVYNVDLKQAPNIETVINANATDIRTDQSGKRVKEIVVKHLSGKTIRVRARQVVLACGGIENPRLLLCSNRDKSPNGLGNTHDQVGRYFMDHITTWDTARIAFTHKTLPSLVFLRTPPAEPFHHMVLGCLSPRERIMKKHKLLNFGLFLDHHYIDQEENDITRDMQNLALDIDNHELELREDLHEKIHRISLTFRMEQTPNPENRVTLQNATDALGMNRVHVHWDMGDQEHHTISTAIELLAQSLGTLQLGRVGDTYSKTNRRYGGPHHMGTTRMHRDPKHGVVDENCRVHGIENLHIAGSSVFPTGGFSNPTFTIMALAIRLTDHLKEIME